MPLDLVILGDDSAPIDLVGIGVEEHWKLIERARPVEQFPLVNRLGDYYGDASIASHEVSILKAELEQLNREGIEKTINNLLAIIIRAETGGKGLEAIAD